jgi:DNA-directed RNA polymerase specialized sigma24 family protein
MNRAAVRKWLPGSEDFEGIPPTQDLAAQVRALPPRQRIATALFYFWDPPEREVAKTMGLSMGTPLFNVRRCLRLQLENDNAD